MPARLFHDLILRRMRQGRRSVVSRGLAMAAVALALSACGDAAEKEAYYLDRGKTLLAGGDRIKAMIEFKNALQINPRSVDALYQMALVSEAEGDLRVAFGSFHRVVEQNPEHVEARLKLANYYFFAEQLDKAREQADAILAVHSRNADALALKAAIALRERRPDEARSGAEQALGIDPSNIAAISVLTGVHLAGGEVQQALSLLEGATGTGSVPLLRLKAEIEAGRNDVAGLEQTFGRMIAAAPREPEHRAALAQLYIRTGRGGEAEKLLRDGVAAAPESWPMKALLVAFLTRSGGPGAAEKELLALQQAEPGNTDYAFALAEYYEGQGDIAKAEAQLKATADRQGGEPRLVALSSLARLKARAGEVNAASDLIRKILSEDPEYAQALLIRAALFLENGSLMNAVTDLRTVLRRRPNERPALELLSEAHRRRGELGLAEDALRQAVEVSRGDARLRLRLAELIEQRGDHAGARALVEAVLQQAPGLDAAWATLARMQMREGAWDAAARSIAEAGKLPGAAGAARQLRAELLAAQGQHAAAAAAYRTLLAGGAPLGRPALFAFTAASVKAGQVGEAAAALEKALASSGAEAAAGWLALGRLYLAEGRREDAEKAFATAIERAPHQAEGYLHLAETLMRGGEVDEAQSALRRGLQAGASRSPLLFMLALSQERSGAFEQAYATYEELLNHDPDSEVAANNIAALVASRFHEDPARLQKALALTKRLQGSRNPLVVDTVAWLAYRAGDVDTAVRLLEQIRHADHPEIRYHRGAVLMARGQADEARRELAAAVDSDVAFAGRDEALRLLAR